MRVLLLTDAEFATRERALLDRLAVGLIDAGIRVILATPRGVPAETPGLLERVWYDPPSTRFGAPRLAGALSAELARRDLADEKTPLDVVHLFGARTWRIGLLLARMHTAGLAVEVWSRALAREAGRALSAGANHNGRVVFVAPGAPLRDEATRRAPATPYALSRWGVHAPADATPPTKPREAPGVVLLANPDLGSRTMSALRGLVSAPAASDAVIFCDERVVRGDRRLGKAVKDLGLRPRFSLLARMESRRAPAMGADLLLSITEPGEHRSIVLDAMASGPVVVTLADPLCDWLHDGRTCTALEQDTPAAWSTAIEALLSDAHARRSLAQSAREWTESERPASRHVSDQIAVYQRLIGRAQPAELAR